jgi:para-aminobenzoate synthetase component I
MAGVQGGQLYAPLVRRLSGACSSMQYFRSVATLPYTAFLDSAMIHPQLGQYSFVAVDPFLIFRSKGGRGTIQHGAQSSCADGSPFHVLRRLLQQFRLDRVPDVPPFLVGGIGYLSYDLCHFVERLPRRAKDDTPFPDCYWAFYGSVAVFDHIDGSVWLAATGAPDGSARFETARAERALDQLSARVVSCRKGYGPCDDGMAMDAGEPLGNFTRDGYLRAVEVAKDYIVAGDVFQVNLSQRFEVALQVSPLVLYERLRLINAAPFAAFLGFPGATLLCSSPERFLRLTSDHVETRPIKGTRPRGITLEEDLRMAAALVESEKDRAENVMIVDLLRNDLGRVCDYGSVRVPALWGLESYARVHHLVSVVEGRLHRRQDRIDLLKACFPGGSITGAPKVRAMEIIDELEPTARGPYTGALGYLGFDGGMDLNIVIRTIAVYGDRAYFQVGGGIVADSQPEAEYQETLDKASALLAALNVCERPGVLGKDRG